MITRKSKNKIISSKLQKQKLSQQIIWNLGIPGSKFGVLEMPNLSLLEKNLNKSKSMKDNSTKPNLEQIVYRCISVSFKFKLLNGKNTSKI